MSEHGPRLASTSESRKRRRVESTREYLLDAAASGNLQAIQQRGGVDVSFDDGAMLRVAAEHGRNEVVAYLLSERSVPVDSASLSNRALLRAAVQRHWKTCKLLLVCGAQYRDVVHYGSLLGIGRSQIDQLNRVVKGFRENYLSRCVLILEEFTHTCANIPGLIMSFNYPQEFKSN